MGTGFLYTVFYIVIPIAMIGLFFFFMGHCATSLRMIAKSSERHTKNELERHNSTMDDVNKD